MLFNTKDVEKFMSCLLKQFPYCTQVRSTKEERKLRKELETNDDPQCVQENLIICHIFTVINRELRNKHQIDCAKNVVSYLQRKY